AFPVIRYRTRDLARFLPEPCPCGRTLTRMSRILGRTDDMLTIGGVNVFPDQIEAILSDMNGKKPPYQIIVDRENFEDKLTVLVEVTEELFFDEVRKQSALADTVQDRLVTDLGIQVHVKLVEEKTLEHIDSKGKKVIDNRKI
ncbi:MAG TPA: phenylacetate--CoA ligase, partial [Desulfobulbaceae bacterium]|nr:phenylacetate--CoA ligase [Desulfobulbaceae bacterium]